MTDIQNFSEDVTIMEMAVPETNNLTIDQIREKIAQLDHTEDGEPLDKAMRELKVALKENPAACSLMLDEDIGKCVHYLSRTINKKILEELEKKPRKNADPTKNIKVTKEEIEKLTLDDLL